jgi:hypothetical protein
MSATAPPEREGTPATQRLLGRLPVPADLRHRYEFYRRLRAIPENRHVSGRDALAPTLVELRGSIPGLRSGSLSSRLAAFEEDLRLLHDVLADSALAGRYWVWCGMLLGWAREGRILPGALDADFAFSAADDARFARAVPALLDAGFRRWFCFRNNAGEITEETFIRRGVKYEFFRMTDVGQQYQYYTYGRDDQGPVELVARLARQELEPFEFLGRPWLKSADHEAELEAIYGDWRTPDPTWTYLNEGTIIGRSRWLPRIKPPADATARPPA